MWRIREQNVSQFIKVSSQHPTHVHTWVLCTCVIVSPYLYMVNSFCFQLANAKQFFEVGGRLRLWSNVIKRGTLLTDRFLLPKLSFEIETTEPYNIPMVSTTSSSFNLRLAKIFSWISSIVSVVVGNTFVLEKIMFDEHLKISFSRFH